MGRAGFLAIREEEMMTQPEKGEVNLRRLKEWIQSYLDLTTNEDNWASLFRRANLSPGTQDKIRNHNKKDKPSTPTNKTLMALAIAMGRDYAEALQAGGYLKGLDPAQLRIHDEYDLTVDEKQLIDAYRCIKIKDENALESYADLARTMIVSMSSAGGMQ